MLDFSKKKTLGKIFIAKQKPLKKNLVKLDI